jgi:hypothetical protein
MQGGKRGGTAAASGGGTRTAAQRMGRSWLGATSEGELALPWLMLAWREGRSKGRDELEPGSRATRQDALEHLRHAGDAR